VKVPAAGASVCKRSGMNDGVWSGLDLHRVHNALVLFLLPGLVLLALAYVLTLHDHVFLALAWYFYFYMIGDAAWIALFPHSVRRAPMLLLHHFLALLFSVFPYLYQSFRWPAALCLLVEINTWSLIGRRHWRTGALHVFLTGVFLVSWFVIRCGVFSYMVYDYYLRWQEQVRVTSNFYNLVMLAPILQLLLVLVQLVWTHEVLDKIGRGEYHYTHKAHHHHHHNGFRVTGGSASSFRQDVSNNDSKLH
jgi:hypothetical protein